MNTHAVSPIAEGDAAWITEDVPAILGRPAHSFERFASDHAAAFAAGGGPVSSYAVSAASGQLGRLV